MKNKTLFALVAFAAMAGVVKLWITVEDSYMDKPQPSPKVAPIRLERPLGSIVYEIGTNKTKTAPSMEEAVRKPDA